MKTLEELRAERVIIEESVDYTLPVITRPNEIKLISPQLRGSDDIFADPHDTALIIAKICPRCTGLIKVDLSILGTWWYQCMHNPHHYWYKGSLQHDDPRRSTIID